MRRTISVSRWRCIRGPMPSTTRASPAAGHQGSSGVIRGHQGSSEVIRGHQRTRADARIAGRAPLVSTCASIAHQLVCRPVCSPDESESHMRAYLMRRAIRRPQSEEGGNQTSSEVISVRASEALPMGHVARREEMDHLRGLGAPW